MAPSFNQFATDDPWRPTGGMNLAPLVGAGASGVAGSSGVAGAVGHAEPRAADSPAGANSLAARVLIVDRSAESRDVLRTALEHRDVHVLEASNPREALELARRQRIDLIVLDLETAPLGDEGSTSDELAALAERAHTPIVLLGSARIRSAAPAGQFVAKPYHYGPLILKIEQLLARK